MFFNPYFIIKMLFRIRTFLQFLWNSTNQHGVHSPFVYLLITKGLYVKTPKKKQFFTEEIGKITRQQRKIIKKLFHYFNPKRSVFVTNDTKLNGDYDCILFEKPNISDFLKTLPNAHNDTIFIFKNPHKNPINHNDWNALVEDKKVIVSIDLYHLGLVFIRKEQLKQHFVIRN